MAMHSKSSNEAFQLESLELGKARLRVGCVAIALLKPLFLPLFYINAPEAFPQVLALYFGLVLICAVTYYLSYKVQRPYALVIIMLVSTYWLVVLSLFLTGMSNSVFFPLLLMCITGIGLIASWSIIHSLIVFGLIVGFYFGGVLLFDPAVDRQRIMIQAMAVGDATLVGTFGIYLLEQVRLKEFRKRVTAYKERETLGRWLHDSLGSDLHNIRLLCELSQQRGIQDPVLRKNAAVISETAKQGMESIRDFIFMVDTNGSSLSNLLVWMNDHKNVLEESAGYKVMICHEIASDRTILSPVQLGNVSLLFKEALTNISKHAKASNVNVDLAADKRLFRLTIADDGVGFDPQSEASGGRGLRNMRARARDIGAELLIDSCPGKGARLSLELSLR